MKLKRFGIKLMGQKRITDPIQRQLRIMQWTLFEMQVQYYATAGSIFIGMGTFLFQVFYLESDHLLFWALIIWLIWRPIINSFWEARSRLKAMGHLPCVLFWIRG